MKYKKETDETKDINIYNNAFTFYRVYRATGRAET